MNFSKLGLHPALEARCKALGYTEPTPIQEQAIPHILGGSDLIGCAETGTGKTAAFLLPIIQKISDAQAAQNEGVRVLILVPTRELASQTAANLQALAPKKRIRSATLIGGASMGRQLEDLRRASSVVIATPGRLLDHLERRSIDLSRIEVLVIDEADRMLDMGFWPALCQVIDTLPARRQTLLFSATMSPAIEKLARSTMRGPKTIDVSPRGRAPVTVDQRGYPVATESKTALLLHLLEREQYSRVLVFTRTRRSAERLSHILSAREHRVDRIHADRTQSQREAALRGFKDGRFRVLVATDIASRGIDVELVSHVINYDVPEAPEDYVHRIGRTGRAGNPGRAVTLITPIEELSMKAIERFTGQEIERVWLPAFAGQSASLPRPAGPFKSFARRSSGNRSFRSRRAGR
ncbi:MAG: DEAD/DEAH box helicase [Blastocatellia bacterium]|nr:DEAD/DEAH box helicase [Blastocatellia bacterium]